MWPQWNHPIPLQGHVFCFFFTVVFLKMCWTPAVLQCLSTNILHWLTVSESVWLYGRAWLLSSGGTNVHTRLFAFTSMHFMNALIVCCSHALMYDMLNSRASSCIAVSVYLWLCSTQLFFSITSFILIWASLSLSHSPSTSLPTQPLPLYEPSGSLAIGCCVGWCLWFRSVMSPERVPAYCLSAGEASTQSSPLMPPRRAQVLVSRAADSPFGRCRNHHQLLVKLWHLR